MLLYSLSAVEPFVKICDIFAVCKIGSISFGTTFFIELSLEPVIVQDFITSHKAMPLLSNSCFFSSAFSGTLSFKRLARTFQKRFAYARRKTPPPVILRTENYRELIFLNFG